MSAMNTNMNTVSIFDDASNMFKLKRVATMDFHITAACSQACRYCWGPRGFHDPVNTETAQRIIRRIKDLGVRRLVFTGGDPLQRSDAAHLIQFAKETGLETALSTVGDLLSPALLDRLSPYLDLISLPLDGPTEQINARTKHPGHFSAVMQSLGWLRAHPRIDVKVCTPVTRYNLEHVPTIAQLVEGYSYSTQAKVFYNIFQVFARAMFTVRWQRLVVSEAEFLDLKNRIAADTNLQINFLDHATLDRLYVMVFPDGSLTIPRGAEYLNFGPFLDVMDLDDALDNSQFDSAKHLQHSQAWDKASQPVH